jgi:hypothetical protein
MPCNLRKARQFLGIIAEELGGIGSSTVKMEFTLGSPGHASVNTGNLRSENSSIEVDRAGDRHSPSFGCIIAFHGQPGCQGDK